MQTQKDTEYIRLEFLIQINTTRESLNKVWEIEWYVLLLQVQTRQQFANQSARAAQHFTVRCHHLFQL